MFKDNLKKLREINNISQYQLAEQIFISRSAIAKWENGLGLPGKESIKVLCEYFKISKDDLFKDENIYKNNTMKNSYTSIDNSMFLSNNIFNNEDYLYKSTFAPHDCIFYDKNY